MTNAADAPFARPSTEIPVAPAVPLLGSLPWMLRDAAGFIERVARERGRLVRVQFGLAGMVLVWHPDDVRHVLQEAHKIYIRGSSTDLIRPMLGNGLPLSDPPFWLRQRRIMQPTFQRGKIASMVATMTTVARRHLDRLRDGQDLSAHSLLLHIARDVITEAMFSQQPVADVEALDRAVVEIDRYIQLHMLLPFSVPLWLPLPDNLRFRRAITSFDRVVNGILDRREQSGDRPGDLLDALFAGRDEETGERMSRRELRDEVMNIFFAGHETTANALTWAILLLTQHPSAWERVRDEVDRVLGDRPPTAEDVPALRITGLVIRETLRLYPPAWMFVRLAAEDDTLAGYSIPRGTMIMLSPFATHRHPDLWPSPRTFDPDRFATDPTTIGATKSWAYLPFGGGPHVCIGNHFALTEITVVLALLAQRGRLRALRPTSARPLAGTTLKVSDGLPARFESRRP